MFYCMSQAQDPSPDTVTSFGQHHLFRYSGCSPRIPVIMFSAALNLLRSPLPLCTLYMYVCFIYVCMYICVLVCMYVYLVTWNLPQLGSHKPLFAQLTISRKVNHWLLNILHVLVLWLLLHQDL